MKIERIQFLIDPNINEAINKYLENEINDIPNYEKDVYNDRNEKIGTLTITKNKDIEGTHLCILSFNFSETIYDFILHRRDELTNIYAFNGKNNIRYYIIIDIDSPLNYKTFLRKFSMYDSKIGCIGHGGMYLIDCLVKGTDLTDKLETSLLLYSLIFKIGIIRFDINLMKYIEEKFLYYGYNIKDKTPYKIDFEEKLNTRFSLEDELLLNSKDYLEMFYELFKYLWNLKTIDEKAYEKKGFYSNIRTYFKQFIELMHNEGIIS